MPLFNTENTPPGTKVFVNGTELSNVIWVDSDTGELETYKLPLTPGPDGNFETELTTFDPQTLTVVEPNDGVE